MVITNGYSQVRYYNWKDTVFGPSGIPVTTGDIISVKKYVFYTYKIKNTTYLYRIDSTGTFTQISYSVAKPLQSTNFCYGKSLDKLFFIDIYHNIKEMDPDILNSSSTVPGADSARGDGIVFGEGMNELYFTLSNGKIGHSQWAGAWTTTTINQSDIKSPKIGSRFAYHGYKLIYTDNDSKLRMLYKSLLIPNFWNNYILNASAPDARGDCLIPGEGDELFYAEKNTINDLNDGRIVHIHWSEATNPPSYIYEIIDYAEPALTGSTMTYGENTLFYVNNANIVDILSWQENNCVWANEHLNSEFKTYGSLPIVYGNSAIFTPKELSGRIYKLKPEIDSNYQFIYLKGREFVHNNNSYYPKILNYWMNLYYDSVTSYFGPCGGEIKYELVVSLCTKSFSDSVLIADLDTIKKLGFNTIRFPSMIQFPEDTNHDSLFIKGINLNNCNVGEPQLSFKFKISLFNALHEVLHKIDSVGLKAIFVTGGLNTNEEYYPAYNDYLRDLSLEFADDTAILAYDYYNEPYCAYNGGKLNTISSYISISKETICGLSKDCYNSIRENDPNHLITIGIAAWDNLDFWDPGIVSADFLSFHIYGDANSNFNRYDQVVRYFKNEMYWVKGNIHLKKPWIIGETGYTATDDDTLSCRENDHILCPSFLEPGISSGIPYTYEQRQRQYCDSTQKDVRACGGSGYSWWDYQDGREYHSGDTACLPLSAGAHYGIFDNCHNAKQIIFPFNSFASDPITGGNFTLPDSMDRYYYGKIPEFDSIIDGYVKDNFTQQPIKDALVVAFHVGLYNTLLYRNHTFTYPDGHFILTYNDIDSIQPNYLAISAMGKERFFSMIDTIKRNKGNIKTTDTIYIDTIYVQDVNCKPSGEPQSAKAINENSKPDLEKSVIKIPNATYKTKLYPNPTKGSVTLAFHLTDASSVQVEILGMLQNTVQSINLGTLLKGDYTRYVNMGDRPNGVYIIKLCTNQSVETFKVIVGK